MSERLPYEDELLKQWSDVPLPDENAAWDDMKRRLNKENDDEEIIAPPLFKGCLGYGLLIIAITIGLLFIILSHKKVNNKNEEKVTHLKEIRRDKKVDTVYNGSVTSSQKDYKQSDVNIPSPNNSKSINPITENVIHENLKHKEKQIKQKTFYQKPPLITNRKKLPLNEHILPANKDLAKKNNNNSEKNLKIIDSVKIKISRKEPDADSAITRSTTISNTDSLRTSDKADTGIITKNIPDSNSSFIKKKNIIAMDQTIKKDSSEKKRFYFGAGLGLQQQLPINGQKLVPYNSLGRKGTLRDYIPSVFVRLYKYKKWLIQSEFRYGAPQYTKQILYFQKRIFDSSSQITTFTSNRLKKTYYHQLPVTFNYFILSDLSVGAGFTWNKFNSAILQQEVQIINNVTFDSTTSKTILQPNKADSNFVKSYFQAIIETQYQWKRFSFGAKYSFGLQPYLKFQLPGDERQEEKNSSLQIFIKYDLWQSKK